MAATLHQTGIEGLESTASERFTGFAVPDALILAQQSMSDLGFSGNTLPALPMISCAQAR